jgi:VanZ family protein
MVMYGVLTLIIWFEYRRSHSQWNVQKLVLYAFLAPIAFGGLMELAQLYLTTCRSGEWLDVLANSTGVVLATLIGIGMACVMKRKKT